MLPRPRVPRALLALLLLLPLALAVVGGAAPNALPVPPVRAQPAAPLVLTGEISGAAYRIVVPAAWNGTLVLYSHGYVVPGMDNPAREVSDPVTGAWLLDQGYALAGSAYRTTGWALEQAFADQIALLTRFAEQVGSPTRVIAWGHSLGGIITAGLIQRFPERFAGALPMCGVLAGGAAAWNQGLDSAFAFKTLLAPDADLEVVRITDPTTNLEQALAILEQAHSTPAGRARLALAAALGHVPGWFDPLTPEPAPGDYAARSEAQYLWSRSVNFLFGFALRAELEQRAGGNPSWNTGVSYADLLAQSARREDVIALYQQAELSLAEDLRTLEQAPRIEADLEAVAYLIAHITFTGDLQLPVLTLHTTDDGLVPVEHEQAYASVVRAAGNADLLRQLYVYRAGHCTFTPAEMIAAFQTFIRRLDTGLWERADDPQALIATALALGPETNIRSAAGRIVPTPPAFVTFQPAAFLRPFDSRSRLPEPGAAVDDAVLVCRAAVARGCE